MNTATNTNSEIACSDNSHIFGIPFAIREELHTSIVIDRKDIREWIDRVEFLEDAGIEFHFEYRREQ